MPTSVSQSRSQTATDRYHKFLDTLTPIERAYEELDALLDSTDDNNMSGIEREYARITGGTVDTACRPKTDVGIQHAVEAAQQRIKELEK